MLLENKDMKKLLSRFYYFSEFIFYLCRIETNDLAIKYVNCLLKKHKTYEKNIRNIKG